MVHQPPTRQRINQSGRVGLFVLRPMSLVHLKDSFPFKNQTYNLTWSIGGSFDVHPEPHVQVGRFGSGLGSEAGARLERCSPSGRARDPDGVAKLVCQSGRRGGGHQSRPCVADLQKSRDLS